MRYETILFDIDDTLLDFKAAEEQALSWLFQDMGVEPSLAVKNAYKEMNQGFWRDHEAGLLSRQDLLDNRFRLFFEQYERAVDGPKTEARYRQYLNQGHQLMENSLEVVQRLSQTEALYIVTNGISVTQHQRLEKSGLAPYFKKFFISEEMGVHKPMKEFFDQVFAEIPQINKDKTVIIGDSLTSDIKGGQVAGIDTIWMNPAQKTATIIEPTYQIRELTDLYQILEDF
ncbi:MAG: YjjG family noncanonical pyrimidine nucleotidase [Enterococcus viikkiensis]|uniref:YjjG family noncanonical pyrimidine nucleotidase n=1 Tax=Enterococcus viikkiensis TaxID=930854 RepID=A0ABU3FSJ5_9ENTE|nr:YjjG family noncanonical pyrimidine nucleotidase [Enterococcus viikkiensis]MDT2827857.1 YjjG family noncanonical pyrimidine nucleotidase [Enterococcus viikkiensis]